MSSCSASSRLTRRTATANSVLMSASVNVELQVACRTETIPHEDEIRGWIEETLRLSGNVAAGEFEIGRAHV